MAKMTQANLRKELLKIMMVGNCSLEDIQKAIDNLRGESKTIQTADNNSKMLHYPPGVRSGNTTGYDPEKFKNQIQMDLIQE